MNYCYPLGSTRWKKFKPTKPNQDVRLYRASAGWAAHAEVIDCHPLTGKPFKGSEWWIKETYEGL